MANLYGLLVSNASQQPMIQARCFDTCGKISMGGALMCDAGALIMCCEPTCPYPNAESGQPLGISRMTGDPVYLRAMKADA